MPEPRDIDAELAAAIEFLESDAKNKTATCEWQGYIYGIALALAWASDSEQARAFLGHDGKGPPRLPEDAKGPASHLVEFIRSHPEILSFVRGETDDKKPEEHTLALVRAPNRMHIHTTDGVVWIDPGDVVIARAEVFRQAAAEDEKPTN